MQESGSQTLARQWAMLRRIPRAPRKTAASELAEHLRAEGFRVSRRTIERDLHALSARFPLVLDDRAKPYGWSWMKDARLDFLPALTTSQAVALLLARAHLQPLLPQNLQKDLGPIFAAAERELAATGWQDWHKRTAIVPATLPLLPPKIDPDVMAGVQAALAQKHCIEGRYRAKGETAGKHMLIHPLGLLARGPVLYLVCTLFGYGDIRQLALHRLMDVAELNRRRAEPEGFDFRTYAATSASAFNSRGRIRLVARFDAAAAEHLRETPLSRDQTWTLLDAGWVEVTATVEDDDRLRWWLLAFGSQVEVIRPAALREDVSASIALAAVLY